MLAGLVSLVHTPRSDYSWSPIDLLNWILPLGFLTIPLLATLPLGCEFQHGTFALLLAQPLDRRKLWSQKMIVTVAAVLPAAILYLFSFARNKEFGDDFWLAAVWIVAATAGSVAGTLLARSAIGGLALSSAFFGTLFVLWSRVTDSERRSGHLSAPTLCITAIFLLLYAVALVWLGRQMFVRFQAIEGGHGADDLLSETRFLPRTVADLLRCKPRGPILNLIRREFHLLRAVWLLTLLSCFTWTFLLLFHLIRPNNFDRAPLPAGLAVILSLLVALLAGSLSLGEEKIGGTHAWQLTMPVSPSTQWAIKLVFALCACVLCALAVPLAVLITRGWISGAPFSYLDHTPLWVWLVAALSSTLLAFWCSCAVKGTVRSVIWFFPLLFALGFSGLLGMWLAKKGILWARPLVDLLLSKVDPFQNNRVIVGLLDPRNDFAPIFAVIVAPLLAAILIQSHRMFRAQAQDGNIHVFHRAILPLATLLSSAFLLTSLFLFVVRVQQKRSDIVGETHRAIETLEANGEIPGVGQVRRFTVDDLAKTGELTSSTLHWLRGSTIVVRRNPIRPSGSLPPIQWPYESAFQSSGPRGKQTVSYAATILTPRGSECNLVFSAPGMGQRGFLFEFCQ